MCTYLPLALALALDFAVAAAVFFLLACFLFGVIFLPPAHQFFPLCFPVHCLPGLQVYSGILKPLRVTTLASSFRRGVEVAFPRTQGRLQV